MALQEHLLQPLVARGVAVCHVAPGNFRPLCLPSQRCWRYLAEHGTEQHIHLRSSVSMPALSMFCAIRPPGCAQVLRLEPHILFSNRTGIPLQLMHFNEGMQQTFDDKAGGATHPNGAAKGRLDIPAGWGTLTVTPSISTCSHRLCCQDGQSPVQMGTVQGFHACLRSMLCLEGTMPHLPPAPRCEALRASPSR